MNQTPEHSLKILLPGLCIEKLTKFISGYSFWFNLKSGIMDAVPTGFFSFGNPAFLGIMLRFVINLFFIFILIGHIYYRFTKKTDFLFTFFLMGIMVFFVTSMLGAIFIDMTFAFGLFAIFAILRFRTASVSIKDMAYIFAVIGLSMMNALKVLKFPMGGVIVFNMIILAAAWILEKYHSRHNTDSHIITFENLELLKPDKQQKLYKEISITTGKEIVRVKINKVDYKRGISLLEIFYKV